MPAKFSRHVAEWLPTAEQVTIEDCGHVPQVEQPEVTNRLLIDFFARAERAAVAPASATQPGDATANAAAA